MLTGADLVAFVATTDLDAAERFYGRALGLPLVDSSPVWRVFDANGTRLRVTRVDVVEPAPYTVLGWSVDDLEAAMAELRGRGVEFRRFDGVGQDEAGVWTAPDGTRVAWLADPDGNTLGVHQAP